MLKDYYKNPPKKYRPAPFWSWNEKLDPEETRRQVNVMNDAGIGGYFMHARGGLQTEYLSDEWFENVRAAIDEGNKNGMEPWGYDENGWPSGFGSGKVNGLGLKYQQKYIRCEKTDAPVKKEHTIINISVGGENHHIFYDVNPFYVDVLDKEVIEEFVKTTHMAYKENLGTDFVRMTGFFTDEPQISRNGYPWSFVLEREYLKAYGKPLAPELAGLFTETENFREVRYNYIKLMRDLFSDSFMKTIHDWCVENGSHLTGHMVLEEGFVSHVLANGSCMSQYEHMDIPGMDHLGRSLASVQTEMQLSSVANQLGKKQILSETYAMCGWNVSFEELRWIFEHQLVHGINYLCQHLEGYSLRGIRKRDYPASLFEYQPWWKDYRIFNDIVSRMGMLIAEGKIDFDILVLNTVESAWMTFNLSDQSLATMYRDRMMDTLASLENAQLYYHLGDGKIIEKYAKIVDRKFNIGTQNYSVVIVPPASCFGQRTAELLEEFKKNGGLVIFTDIIPQYIDGKRDDRLEKLAETCPKASCRSVAGIVPDKYRRITLSYKADGTPSHAISTTRRFDDEGMTMYYVVNPGFEKQEVTAAVKGGSATMFDVVTGEEKPAVYTKFGDTLYIEFTLYERNSAVIFVYDDESRLPEKRSFVIKKPLTDELKGEWKVLEADDNALTLDYCDMYFDGKLAYEDLPISDAEEKALAFGKRVKTRLVYHFDVRETGFGKCELVTETPEIFDIEVNGVKIDKKILGYYRDRSFKTIDIFPYIKKGKNEIAMTCDFEQSEKVYDSATKSLKFETEKNKLTYDMELEAIYIKGDFAVRSDNPFEQLERRGVKTDGGFYLVPNTDTVTDGNLAEQGYPFFNGSITLKKTVNLTKNEINARSFAISKLSSTVTNVRVNGIEAGKIMWHPYEVSLDGLLKEGENVFEITVTGNLRNLLGPFHLKTGESYSVSPTEFFHESPIWVKGINTSWTDTYCFAEYGLFF